MERPNIKPKNPNFSSGPCAKRPGWSIDVLKKTPIGRSHRHKVCTEKLNKDKLHAKQVSARGGELYCKNIKNRVLIAGNAKLYMKGEIEIS